MIGVFLVFSPITHGFFFSVSTRSPNLLLDLDVIPACCPCGGVSPVADAHGFFLMMIFLLSLSFLSFQIRSDPLSSGHGRGVILVRGCSICAPKGQVNNPFQNGKKI